MSTSVAIKRRKISIVIYVTLLTLIAIATPIGLRLWRLLSYAQQQTIGARLIESLRDQSPKGVSTETWDHATGWAVTAYHNVCFSESHVTFEELVRFNKDAKVRLAEDIDLLTIDWVWARLAETGPHGQKYVSKFEPEYTSVVYGSTRKETSSQSP
jgi:hypothetical protein